MFDHIRNQILSCSPAEVPSVLSSLMDSFREDDYPNFNIWISVFNKLDDLLLGVISKYKCELFLPFVWSEVYTTISAEAIEASARSCPWDVSSDALAALKTIIRWTCQFTKQAFNKGVYHSLEHMLVCLRAFDDELASSALEVLNNIVLLPPNHRKLLMYDGYDAFVKPPLSTKRFYQSFYDLAIATSTDSLLSSARVAEIIAAAASPVDVTLPSSSVDGHDKPYAERKMPCPLLNYLKADEIECCAKPDVHIPVLSHRPSTSVRGRAALQHALEATQLGHLSTDGLRTAVVSALSTARTHCIVMPRRISEECVNGDACEEQREIDPSGSDIEEDAFALLWRLRLQRMQLHALNSGNSAALWDVRALVYQIHHLLVCGHHEIGPLALFYKSHVSSLLEPCSAIYLADQHFQTLETSSKESAPLLPLFHNSFLTSVRWAIALLAGVTKKKFNEHKDKGDDDDSQKPAPSMYLRSPFDAVLTPLGLGTRQMMGLLPSVIKRSTLYLRSMPLDSASLPVAWVAVSTERLRFIEWLLYIMLHLCELRTAVPTLVENGIVHALIDVMKPPGMQPTPHWDALIEDGARRLCAFGSDDAIPTSIRNLQITEYESLRLCIDSFVSQILDLMICKKFARDTFTALSGLEVYVWRLYYELECLSVQKERLLDQPYSPHISLKSLFLSLLSMFSGSLDDALVKWVRSGVFVTTVRDLSILIAQHSTPLFTTLVNTLDGLVQSDPDVGGIVKHFHSSGILEHTWLALQNLRDTLDSDCLDAFLTFTYTLHISRECLEFIMKRNVLHYVLSLCFHSPRSLCSESQLFLETGPAFGLGERLHEWCRISDEMKTHVVAAILEVLEFLGAQGHELACAASLTGCSPYEDAVLLQLYSSVLILIGALLETDEQHGSPEVGAEFLEQNGLERLLDTLNAAHATPYYFLLSHARWDTFSLENRQCEIECCFSEIVHIVGILYQADRVAVLKTLTSIIQANVQAVAIITKNDTNQKDNMGCLSALSDDITSVVRCIQDGRLNILTPDKTIELSPNAAASESAGHMAYLPFLRLLSRCSCYIQCMHMVLCGEVYDDEESQTIKRELTQIVATVVGQLCSSKLMVRMATETFNATKQRIQSLAIEDSNQKRDIGCIVYKLFVVSKAKVKESPDFSSRTLAVLHLRCAVRAVRAVEMAGADEEATMLWYELEDGGWISQNNVNSSKNDFFGTQDTLQVALVNMEWDAQRPASRQVYNTFECIADVASARQAGVYLMNALYVTAEIFLTEAVAHLHATLPWFTGFTGRHVKTLTAPKLSKTGGVHLVVPNIARNIQMLIEVCQPLYYYKLANGTCYSLETLRTRDISAVPQLHLQEELWGLGAEHVLSYLQLCCACTGMLFGKQLEKDLAVDQKGINVLSLLHLLYGSTSATSVADSILHNVLCGTALVFQACFPCPLAITSQERRRAWDLRRAAALSAVDEVLHFWFLLLYCSAPFLHGKARNNDECKLLADQVWAAMHMAGPDINRHEHIDMFQVLQDAAALWAVIVLPLLSQIGLSQLPPAVLAKVTTCLSQARNSFSGLADEQLRLLALYNICDKPSCPSDVDDVIQELYQCKTGSDDRLPLSRQSLYEEEVLALARPFDKSNATFEAKHRFMLQSALPPIGVRELVWKKHLSTLEPQLNTIPDSMKYFRGAMTPPRTPALIKVNPTGPAGNRAREQYMCLRRIACDAHHALAGVVKLVAATFHENPFVNKTLDDADFASSRRTPCPLDRLALAEETRAVVPICLMRGLSDTRWSDSFLNILNCCVAGLANGLHSPSYVLATILPSDQPPQLLMSPHSEGDAPSFHNSVDGELRREMLDGEQYLRHRRSLHQGYRAVAVVLAWLSADITRSLQIELAGDQGNSGEAVLPERKQRLDALEGQLHAFYLLMSCGTNNITLISADKITPAAHETHLDALCVLWRLHPQLTPLNQILQKFIARSTPASSDAKFDFTAQATMYMALQCLDALTRQFASSRSLDVVVLSLAAVIPDALFERSYQLSSRALPLEDSARWIDRLEYIHNKDMKVYADKFMTAYTAEDIDSIVAHPTLPEAHRDIVSREPSWTLKWSWTDEFAYIYFMSQIRALFAARSKSQPTLGASESIPRNVCAHAAYIVEMHSPSSAVLPQVSDFTAIQREPSLTLKAEHLRSHCLHSADWRMNPCVLVFRATADPAALRKLVEISAALTDTAIVAQLQVPQIVDKNAALQLLSALRLLLHSVSALGTDSEVNDISAVFAALTDPQLALLDKLWHLNSLGGCSATKHGASSLRALATSLLQVTNTLCQPPATPQSAGLLEIETLDVMMLSLAKAHAQNPFESFYNESDMQKHISAAWRFIYARDPLLVTRVLNSAECARRVVLYFDHLAQHGMYADSTQDRAFDRVASLKVLSAASTFMMQLPTAHITGLSIAPGLPSEKATQRALDQVERTRQLGKVAGEALMKLSTDYWSSLLQCIQHTSENSPSVQLNSETALTILEQRDLRLAQALIQEAEIIFMLTPAGYFWPYYMGMQEAFQQTLQCSTGLNSEHGRENATDSVQPGATSSVQFVLQILLMPVAFGVSPTCCDWIGAHQMHASSQMRSAALYFLAAHLSAPSGDTLQINAAQAVTRELIAINSEGDDKMRLRRMFIFADAICAMNNVAAQMTRLRRVFTWDKANAANALLTTGFYEQLGIAHSRILLSYPHICACIGLDDRVLRWVLDTCLSTLGKYLSDDWEYIENGVISEAEEANEENNDSKPNCSPDTHNESNWIAQTLLRLSLGDTSAATLMHPTDGQRYDGLASRMSAEESSTTAPFTPPKFSATGVAGNAEATPLTEVAALPVWQSPEWHMHSGVSPSAPSASSHEPAASQPDEFKASLDSNDSADTVKSAEDDGSDGWEDCSDEDGEEESAVSDEDTHNGRSSRSDGSDQTSDIRSFDMNSHTSYSRDGVLYARYEGEDFQTHSSDEGRNARRTGSPRSRARPSGANESFELPALSPRAARRRCVSALMMPGASPSRQLSPNPRNAARLLVEESRAARRGARRRDQSSEEDSDEDDEDDDDSESLTDVDSDNEPSVPEDYVQEADTDYGGTEEDSQQFTLDTETKQTSPVTGFSEDMFSLLENMPGASASKVLAALNFKPGSLLAILHDTPLAVSTMPGLSAHTWLVAFPNVCRTSSRDASEYQLDNGLSMDDTTDTLLFDLTSCLCHPVFAHIAVFGTRATSMSGQKGELDNTGQSDSSFAAEGLARYPVANTSDLLQPLESTSNSVPSTLYACLSQYKTEADGLLLDKQMRQDLNEAINSAHRSLSDALLLNAVLRLHCSAQDQAFPRSSKEEALQDYNMLLAVISDDPSVRWEDHLLYVLTLALEPQSGDFDVDGLNLTGGHISSRIQSAISDWQRLTSNIPRDNHGERELEHALNLLYLLYAVVDKSARRKMDDTDNATAAKVNIFVDQPAATLLAGLLTNSLSRWSTQLQGLPALRRVVKVLWRVIKSHVTVYAYSTADQAHFAKHGLHLSDALLSAITQLYIRPDCNNDVVIWTRLRRFISFWCGSAANTENDMAYAAQTELNWKRLRKMVVLPVARQLTMNLGRTMASLSAPLQAYAEHVKLLTQQALVSGDRSARAAAIAAIQACPELPAPGDENRLTQVVRLLQGQPPGLHEITDSEDEAAIAALQQDSTWDALCSNFEYIASVEISAKQLMSSLTGESPAPVAAGAVSRPSNPTSPRRQTPTNTSGTDQQTLEPDDPTEVAFDTTRVVSPLLLRFSSALEAYLNVMCVQYQLSLPSAIPAVTASAAFDRLYKDTQAVPLLSMTPGSLPNLQRLQQESSQPMLSSVPHDAQLSTTATTAVLQVPETRDAFAPIALQRQFSLPGTRFRAGSNFQAMHRNLHNPTLSARLSTFVSKTRLLLNARLKQHPRLLEGPLVALLVLPECRRYLDFSVKRKFLTLRLERMVREQNRMHEENGSGEAQEIYLHVHRDSVFEDSMLQVLEVPGENLLGSELVVTFDGEEGVDEGGLTREWYGVLTREIFRPHYELFTPAADGVTFQLNPQSSRNPDHLRFFRFVGRVLAKAMVDGQLLDVHFTRTFYKHLLGQPVSFHDLKDADPGYYKNLQLLLAHNLEDLGLELTFTAEPEEGVGREPVELVPGGNAVAVTDANKGEYVKLLAHHKMTASVRLQIDAFLQGFHEVVPAELISIFETPELELLMCGMPEIDIDDMQANCGYSGYKQSDPTIQSFWSVLRQFTREEKALFVQFVTGSAKVPLEGFAFLRGAEGVQRMSVHKAYDTSLLPTAHTCFNQLDLPDYADEAKLREMLLVALRHGAEGFGFA